MSISVVLLAAGRGSRFASRTPKILALLSGKPVLLYSLLKFDRYPGVNEIIVVTSKRCLPRVKLMLRGIRLQKQLKIILGGEERQHSVFNGLRSVSADSRFVFIHDAARPFFTVKLLDNLLKAAQAKGAAIPGIPLKATIKEIKSVKGGRCSVVRTPARDKFREIQTPQVFKKELIELAYEKFCGRGAFTDDASLVEALGKTVTVVDGDYFNMKITTPEDLSFASAIVQQAG